MDELVDEWTPEPLGQALSPQEQADLAAVPVISGPNGPRPKIASTGKTAVNLASFNFTGLSGSEEIKERAVDILRKYGLGSCGPPGFYGTLGERLSVACQQLTVSTYALFRCTYATRARHCRLFGNGGLYLILSGIFHYIVCHTRFLQTR